jgi:SpoVK/Ycf46/Vps4 family AAA+-type ATPase
VSLVRIFLGLYKNARRVRRKDNVKRDLCWKRQGSAAGDELLPLPEMEFRKNRYEGEHVLQDLEKFRASRPRYRRLGVPYHRGYLLYGPPGTGKTSLVSGLAAKCGMSIYVLNLTEFNDRTLKNAMNDVPENSVILFEDIDCMKAGHRRSESDAPSKDYKPREGIEKESTADRFGVTLSGLLNVLDGFHAPENVVFMMTTNQVEALDPALLRPGGLIIGFTWERLRCHRR